MPDMRCVTSTSVAAIGYAPEARELYVRFRRSGKTYVYLNVEVSVFRDFVRSSSKGAFLNCRLRGVYDYRAL
ncbi:MAG: KTSC domain-containing protein [Gammaproteobacteria bacterium]|nr:KTSC domain-containing protein [Gammaproteobacteria bacterium]